MCAPAAILIPIIASGVSGAASVASTLSARKQVGVEQANADAYRAENQANATASTRKALQDLDAKQLEDMLATSQKLETINSATKQVSSTAKVASAEAGVAGNSVDELLNDVQAQASRASGVVKQNQSITDAETQRMRDSVIANGITQYNSVRPVKINKPSLLSPLLQIGGSVLQTIDQIKSRDEALRNPIPPGH